MSGRLPAGDPHRRSPPVPLSSPIALNCAIQLTHHSAVSVGCETGRLLGDHLLSQGAAGYHSGVVGWQRVTDRLAAFQVAPRATERNCENPESPGLD